MRKIRLSDTDIELFDMEVSPAEFLFFTKHKDAFRCMWKEQGKPFWTRFIISFRSYTVKHGVIKQMSFESPKLNDLLDQGFINMHEQFLDGTATSAKSFVEDIARLAQNHDKFPNLDSKNFAKDPFYCRDTRELFRQFFGSPDQKASYLKVYILSPVYLRFGGSVCRCLKRWMDAPPNECNDESYWIPPEPDVDLSKKECKVIMCNSCLDECGTLYFQEKLCGSTDGPKFIESWTKGDPRFNDKKNPLYNKLAQPDSDWRTDLSVEDFKDFVYYSNNTYGDKCNDCLSLTNYCPLHSNQTENDENNDSALKKKKKRKKKKKDKVKESESVKNEEEIEKLVNHIEGKAPLDIMPENTVAGAKEKSPAKETSPPANEVTEDTKSQVKKEIFSKKAKISDDFKYGIMPFQDKTGADLKRSVIGGFKVKKIEDERTGAFEITVNITTIKGENAKDKSLKIPGHEKTLEERKINRFPLSADILRTRMVDLPKKMEWYEGWNWCASVMNYEEEEKHLCSKPTNFTIKVNGKEEESVKRTMFKLLFYVLQRKSRPCPGWNMEDDDIVACILPDESTEFEGTTISIIRGFRFEERLTDEEKTTMQAPSDECIKPKKVMMTWKPSKAKSIMSAPPSKARQELRDLLLTIQEISTRVLEIPDDCPPQKRRQLELKRQRQITLLTTRPLLKIDEGPMFNQMRKNPDTFQLFIMAENDKVEELDGVGMIPIDVEIADTSNGNLCECCGQHNIMCMCTNIGGRKKQLPECNCIDCLTELCIGELAGDLDSILAEDGSIKEITSHVTKKSKPLPVKSDEESPVKKVILNVQNMKRVPNKRQVRSPVKKEKDLVITKKIAQSVPQPNVIKIDKSPSFDHTLKEIHAQTAAYFQDVKLKSEKDQNLDKKDASTKTSIREKPVSDVKTTEQKGKNASQQTDISTKKQKKQKADENSDGSLKNTIEKSGGQVEKISTSSQISGKCTDKVDTEAKKKIEIEIKIPLKTDELPEKDSFELNEQFVKRNPELLKKIITALENSDNIECVNMMTDDAKSKVKIENRSAEDKLEKIPSKPSEKGKSKNPKDKLPCCKDGKVCHNFVPVTPEDIERYGKMIDEKLKLEKKATTQKGTKEVVTQTTMSVSLKETEKSFNIIKQTSIKCGEPGNLISKILEEAEEKIVFEEYDNGTKADIIMMGEPQCPCQARAKQLMKQKLKLKTQGEQAPTLKQELSHKLNCPAQLKIREEKQAASRPPRMSHDPNFDINDIIEEQLMDSFNIKKLCSLGMKIYQNAASQTQENGEGDKTSGFKERVLISTPWTEERSRCVKEPDPNLQAYLKQINYRQEARVDVGIQAIKNGKQIGKTDDGKENDGEKGKVKEKNANEVIDNAESNMMTSKLRRCASCDVVEPSPKAFMKCQKCKVEGVSSARYYCGRDCQVKDWTVKHKKEHKDKLLT